MAFSWHTERKCRQTIAACTCGARMLFLAKAAISSTSKPATSFAGGKT